MIKKFKFLKNRFRATVDRLPSLSLRRNLAFEHLELRRLLAVVNFPLVNAGFESPDLDINNSYYAAIDGWTTSGVLGHHIRSPRSRSLACP